MLTGIRWTRVVLAAVLSEAGVIAVVLAIIAIYRSLIAPGMTDAEYQTLGSRVGYYVAPIRDGHDVSDGLVGRAETRLAVRRQWRVRRGGERDPDAGLHLHRQT